MNDIIDDMIRFPVQGAGDLIISNKPCCSCGTATGYHVAVTWGKYGESGGVMDWKTALKLATHIFINVFSVIPAILQFRKIFEKYEN